MLLHRPQPLFVVDGGMQSNLRRWSWALGLCMVVGANPFGTKITSGRLLFTLCPHILSAPSGGRHIVAVDVATPRPCGPFLKNATFYMRVGVRDMKIFKQVFQAQVRKGCYWVVWGREGRREGQPPVMCVVGEGD